MFFHNLRFDFTMINCYYVTVLCPNRAVYHADAQCSVFHASAKYI